MPHDRRTAGEELEALSGVIDAAAHGHGRGLLLVGEAGVGKSRLATAAAEAAQSRGMDVLTGRAVRSGLATPYRALSERYWVPSDCTTSPDTRELAPFQPALGVLRPSGGSGPSLWRNRGLWSGRVSSDSCEPRL